MPDAARHRWSEAEFLDWLQGQEQRHELVDGEPRAMVGATRRHDLVVVNILTALRGRLRGGPCRPGSPDTAIRIPNGNIRYPGVTVDCGEFRETERAASEPRLVVEVLSPSTATFDQTEKLEEHRSVASLAHVLVVGLDQPRVRLHTRDARGAWSSAPVGGLEAEVKLTALGIALPLAEIYEGLTFRAQPRLVPGEPDLGED